MVGGRILIYLIWETPESEVILMFNPNITTFDTKKRSGVATEVGGVTLSAEVRGMQIGMARPVQTVIVGGETLRVTLQSYRKPETNILEVRLLVETGEPVIEPEQTA